MTITWTRLHGHSLRVKLWPCLALTSRARPVQAPALPAEYRHPPGCTLLSPRLPSLPGTASAQVTGQLQRRLLNVKTYTVVES